MEQQQMLANGRWDLIRRLKGNSLLSLNVHFGIDVWQSDCMNLYYTAGQDEVQDQ
jgi:hypothetical protein